MDTRPPRAAAVSLWRYPGWATYHERLPPQRRYKKQLPAYRLFIASVFWCHRCGRNDSTLLWAMQRFCLGFIVDNFVICFWPFVFEIFCASDLLIYAPTFIFFFCADPAIKIIYLSRPTMVHLTSPGGTLTILGSRGVSKFFSSKTRAKLCTKKWTHDATHEW